ncbi:MAG: ABC transporter ATP-binding protein [Neisseriaceae bacterium]|nr:ABC transporter ATP-binding protein [Neisseriaceae bacterium]
MKRNYTNQKTRSVQSVWNTYGQLIHSAGDQKGKLLRCLGLATLTAVLFGVSLGLLYPFFEALVAHDWPRLKPILALLVGLLFISSLLRMKSEDYDTKGYANKAIHQLRHDLGKKLREIPLLHLSSQRSGEINAILVQSVNEAAGYAFTLITSIIYGITIPIAAAVTLSVYDWRFAAIMLVVFPLSIPLYLWRRRAFRRGFSILAEANGQLKGEAIEYIQGLDVLKSTGQVQSKQSQFGQVAKDVAAIQKYGTKKGEVPNLIITSTVQIGLILIVLLGMVWVGGGSASYLLLATALVIVARASDMLNFFVQMSSLLEIFVIGSEKLQDLMAQPSLPERHCEAMPTRYDIQFEQVHFRYGAEAKASLSNVNLTIPEKSFTALVGSSGSGKTTLTRMILRYADPDAGSVKIGGVDVRDMSQSQLMSLIAVVFQDVYLFQDSILNNIRMAKPDAGDEEVIAAAQQAQCHEFISRLPQGYATPLADIGSSLSGGEKQRIAIARAILKDAPILILDEPTAALDTKNELAVQKALDALVKNKTILVIAHRLSTVVGAQQIFVLDGGAVVEQGQHQTLLAQQGQYAGFWQVQHQGMLWGDQAQQA